MSGDNGLGLVILGVLAIGYVVALDHLTFRGCRRAWLWSS